MDTATLHKSPRAHRRGMSPTQYANYLQERRTDYGTNTARQRPRYDPPVEQQFSVGDITAERAAFCDSLYEAAGLERNYPRDLGVRYDYEEGEVTTLYFAEAEWPVAIVLRFDFMDRLRYRVRFENGDQYALTQGQVRHLRTPQAALSRENADAVEIVLLKRGSGRRHPARIPARKLSS